MTPTKVKKKFDCLAYKDKVQAQIYEEIKGLTVEEQIQYFQEHSERGPLRHWWKKVRHGSAKGK